MEGERKGKLVVVSAVSGTGKSTVCGLLKERDPAIAVSISYTTRPPRGKEQNGIHYHFVDDGTFDRMVAEGKFLEWARVHDWKYGTSLNDVEKL
ncbi:MAG: guanylate kinase, partial [Deltaproteobacteria bacterium]